MNSRWQSVPWESQAGRGACCQGGRAAFSNPAVQEGPLRRQQPDKDSTWRRNETGICLRKMLPGKKQQVPKPRGALFLALLPREVAMPRSPHLAPSPSVNPKLSSCIPNRTTAPSLLSPAPLRWVQAVAASRPPGPHLPIYLLSAWQLGSSLKHRTHRPSFSHWEQSW